MKFIKSLILLSSTALSSGNLLRHRHSDETNERMLKKRIIGGFAAPEGRYPYVVSLQSFDGSHFCGKIVMVLYEYHAIYIQGLFILCSYQILHRRKFNCTWRDSNSCTLCWRRIQSCHRALWFGYDWWRCSASKAWTATSEIQPNDDEQRFQPGVLDSADNCKRANCTVEQRSIHPFPSRSCWGYGMVSLFTISIW